MLHKLIELVINRSMEAGRVLTDSELDALVDAHMERANLFSAERRIYDPDVIQKLGLTTAETEEKVYCRAWVKSLMATLFSTSTNLLTLEAGARLNLSEAIARHELIAEHDFLMSAFGKGKIKVSDLKDVLGENRELLASVDWPDAIEKNVTGFMTGQIDLLLKARDGSGEKFWVLDWKSNSIRNNERHSADWSKQYDRTSMQAVVEHHAYALQALIYLTALYRYLKRFYGQRAMERIGGAVYIFLRGLSGDEPECGRFVMDIDSMAPAILRLDAILGKKEGSDVA